MCMYSLFVKELYVSAQIIYCGVCCYLSMYVSRSLILKLACGSQGKFDGQFFCFFVQCTVAVLITVELARGGTYSRNVLEFSSLSPFIYRLAMLNTTLLNKMMKTGWKQS